MRNLLVLFAIVLAMSCTKRQTPTHCYICKSTDTLDGWNGYNPCDVTQGQMTTFELLHTSKGDTAKCVVSDY